MSDTVIVCANKECRVAQDGKCVEGLKFEECRFYGKNPEVVLSEDESGDDAVEFTAPGIALNVGIPLDAGGATRILGRLPSRVVAIVGAFDSGKTSLIAGLYDLFQIKPVGAAKFAGSATLIGFEEICHDARASSRRNTAHSPRTKRGEVKFYHFDLKSSTDDRPLSLLIGDRSGEEYEEVANEVANSTGMFELRRADVVTLLVDGVRLCDPSKRHDAVGALPLILQGLFEGGVLAQRPRLAIVLTKDDAVAAVDNPERVRKAFEGLVQRVSDRYSAVFSSIRDFTTAASPKDAKTERGAGLAELLSYWLEPKEVPTAALPPVKGERVFANLQPRED